MCCLITSLFLLGPRFGIIIWGLAQPTRWDIAFSTFIWPLFGFLFLPWTTLAYVALSRGGVNGLEWIWIAVAVLADLSVYSGGAYGNRDRIRRYAAA